MNPGAPKGRARRQRGFNLTELMIAMTIGLFLLMTLGYVLLGARSSFRTLDALSRMQENARFAFESMAADIRMAGFTGGPVGGGSPVNDVCDEGEAAPCTDPDPPFDPGLKDLYDEPLRGYEEGEAFPTGVSGQPGLTGDALTVVRADTDTEYALSDHSEPGVTLDFGTCPSRGLPQAGEIFVLSDYTHSAVFQIRTVSSCAGGDMTLDYGTGTVTPGNRTGALGAFSGDLSDRKVYRLRGASYYVADDGDGEPGLYRLRLGHSGTSADATPQRVVEGVEDMQITYGEDDLATTGNAEPLQVSHYRTADEVDDWGRVLSVRIELDLVSHSATRVTTTDDGLLHKTLTNTIAVRNRLLTTAEPPEPPEPEEPPPAPAP